MFSLPHFIVNESISGDDIVWGSQSTAFATVTKLVKVVSESLI